MALKSEKGVKLFFFGFVYWCVFMLIALLLGVVNGINLLFIDYFVNVLLFLSAMGLGFVFAKNYKKAILRDVCFIGFFWVWLSVMFEYWFLTYLNNYSPDYVLRNNMLFSSWGQIITYMILFFSPMYFFKKQGKVLFIK